MEGAKPYQAVAKLVEYELYEPLKLDHLNEQTIIMPLAVTQTVEWCSSFVIMPKPNGTVCLCLDHIRLNGSD